MMRHKHLQFESHTTVCVLDILGASVLPLRLCLICGFSRFWDIVRLGYIVTAFTFSLEQFEFGYDVLLLLLYFSFSRHWRRKRILGFQLRAKAHSALVFCSMWLRVTFVSCWFTQVFHGGSLHSWLPTGSVLHLCCWYQNALSARLSCWGFGSLPLMGPKRYRSPLNASEGDGRANCAGVTAAYLGFLDPLCGTIPPTSLHVYWVIVYIHISISN